MGVYQIYPKKRKNILSGLSANLILVIITLISFFLFTLFIFLNFLSIDHVAMKPANIFEGKFLWTFLTSMFMHGGFFHLFVNMFSLFFVGSLAERILGPKRYFWFYITAGLFAGLFFVFSSLLFASDFNSYAVGASGALFGIVGLLMMLTPNLPVYVMFIPIPVKLKYAGPGILILLWLISLTTNVGIGNTAHLGGLIAGLIYGIYLRKKYKNKTQYLSRYFS